MRRKASSRRSALALARSKAQHDAALGRHATRPGDIPWRGWRQVIRRGTVKLLGDSRVGARDRAGHTDRYARAAVPVTSAQVWKAWVRAAR
jgi:hypothetical protein